jgi:putative tricarboxylic transport membrane protein
MDIFNNVIYGFQVACQPVNFLYCFIGVFIGTLIGVLPGIGPVGAISLLLPITFHIPPISAIIMLAGIYYGSMYGGSTTSILVNIPGEATSVVTCMDGYQMARRGRAGPALGISAFGSFIAGNLSIIGLMFLVYPLASVALRFGPPEFFTLMCLGLILVTYLARGSMVKALMMAVWGLALSFVGMDLFTSRQRFVFGIPQLMDGVGLIPLVMGLFGISEVLINIGTSETQEILKTKIRNIFPNLKDWKESILPIIRGTGIGFFLGILPGAGALTSPFMSYVVEKKLSKNPEKFGTGAIEGVAGPEAANNAATGGAFIPLLSLGIPPNVIMALLLGALMIHGIFPGPLFIQKYPELFWGTIASMYVGNTMLLILNLPLIPFWVQILKVPYKILFPLILLFCLIGVYSVNNSLFDVILMIIFGILGYFLRRSGFELAPLVLAFVLGPIMERTFRQSLIISGGSFSIFLERPIAGFSLVITLILIFYSFIQYAKTKGLFRS